MEEGIVREGAVGPDPEALHRLLAAPWLTGQLADVALVDGVGLGEPVARAPPGGLEPVSRVASSSGAGTSGIGNWWERPVSSTWNEADMLKMAWPCWMATTRRVVNERPSRMRSTS